MGDVTGFTHGAVRSVSIAVTPNPRLTTDDEPWVAFKDESKGGRCSVYRVRAGEWRPIGELGFSLAEVNYVNIEFDALLGFAFVAFQDYSQGGRASVYSYRNLYTFLAWLPVGDLGFTAGDAQFVSLAIDAIANEPYVAFRDEALEGKASVYVFRNTEWLPVIKAGFSSGEVEDLSLAFDQNTGQPFLALRDEDFGGRVTVYTIESGKTGTQWQPLGYPAFSEGEGRYIHLVVNFIFGMPLVVFRDYANDSKLSCYAYTSGAWTPIGEKGFTKGPAMYPSITISPGGGMPMIAFQDQSEGDKLSVYRLVGGEWLPLGGTGVSGGAVLSLSSVRSKTGSMMVAYADGSEGGKHCAGWEASMHQA